ncbi:MAG TPA: zinc-dependent metalloprotease [Solirubrobacteraceae bacterium]|nr:zinc-dependent metalloprotease [Solirubrobacteraceae bacterium]
MEFVDWRVAQRVGELIAGTPPFGSISSERVEPMAHDFAVRVAAYSGLRPPAELPRLELVDRPVWIAANLRTMRPLLGRLSERAGIEPPHSALAYPLRSATGLLMGAQVGALTGMLSQRVLGQYDLALLDASVPPRLLLLAPNLAQAAAALELDRDELVLWVTIHEITHAVQFSGAPWLREHLAGLITELIDGLEVSVNSSGGGWIPKLPAGGDLRDLVERARRGDLLRMTIGEDRWRLVERIQATMSLVEGHAEHTMDVIGAQLLPSLDRLRAAMNARRQNRGLPWRVLERLLGLELKLRQYETGRRFCDAVVDAAGPPALARAWESPATLPRPDELERPTEWMARVSKPPAALPAQSGA